jgi:hypothetical protein
MTDTRRIRDLLDGPRGRRLCLSLVASAFPQLWTIAFYAAQSEEKVPELIRAVAEATVAVDAASLLDALEASTGTAMYWQPADETDVILRDTGLVAALEHVAESIAESADTDWWWSPIALDEQRYVRWIDEFGMQPPTLTGAAERLADWKSRALASEVGAAEYPADVAASFSGSWWSIPAFTDIVTTTRALSGLGAAKLRLVEDGHSWDEAHLAPLRPRTTPRVFEITGPEAWAALVGRYARDVTLSRRHDWWNVTGEDVRWVLPDWEAVASDFDAVHLTVGGYLGTAGRALPVDDAFTMLAGWNPDETYWFTDILEPGGPTVRWSRDAATGSAAWHETGAVG